MHDTQSVGLLEALLNSALGALHNKNPKTKTSLVARKAKEKSQKVSQETMIQMQKP